MARLLMSNKIEGPYEYVFEPLVKDNVERAVERYLAKYGYVRRILVHPCGKRSRILSLIVLGKDERRDYEKECCNSIRLEHREFMVDKEKIKETILGMLEKVNQDYAECAKKFSEKLLLK